MMHTVRVGGGSTKKWVVQFVESTGDKGFRPSRDNIASFSNFLYACAYASWMNGGPEPNEHIRGEAIRSAE